MEDFKGPDPDLDRGTTEEEDSYKIVMTESDSPFVPCAAFDPNAPPPPQFHTDDHKWYLDDNEIFRSFEVDPAAGQGQTQNNFNPPENGPPTPKRKKLSGAQRRRLKRAEDRALRESQGQTESKAPLRAPGSRIQSTNRDPNNIPNTLNHQPPRYFHTNNNGGDDGLGPARSTLTFEGQRLATLPQVPVPPKLSLLSKGRLDGRVVVITGAGQGIGKACCNLFIREGAQVIATDINLDKLMDLRGLNGIAKILKVDLTSKADILELRWQVMDRVDVILNCAKIVPEGPLLECDDISWDRTMDTNVRGVFYLCQTLLPIPLESGRPCSIINLAPQAPAGQSMEGRFVYSSARGALIGLTKSIALDYASRNIRANVICPGSIQVTSWAKVNGTSLRDVRNEDILFSQHAARITLNNSVSSLALYLASQESSAVNGQEFVIDGSWSH